MITDQVAKITANAPGWLDQLQQNSRIQDLDDEYQIIDKIREYVTDGDFLGTHLRRRHRLRPGGDRRCSSTGSSSWC